MRFHVGPPIRKTCGKVVKYDQRNGYGWICIGDERWRDAFLSYRDYEPEKDEKKVVKVGQFVKFDLHENEKGYVAKNVHPISEKDYKRILGEIV